MPHSIIHGNACLAYFNKIWGIPVKALKELIERVRHPGLRLSHLYVG
jgi:hypothetical protein